METRSVNQLLKLMLENIDFVKEAKTGLCDVINMLRWSVKISGNDWICITNYFIANRPDGKSSLDYWWPKGEITPRIEWLKKHIELTNEN